MTSPSEETLYRDWLAGDRRVPFGEYCYERGRAEARSYTADDRFRLEHAIFDSLFSVRRSPELAACVVDVIYSELGFTLAQPAGSNEVTSAHEAGNAAHGVVAPREQRESVTTDAQVTAAAGSGQGPAESGPVAAAARIPVIPCSQEARELRVIALLESIERHLSGAPLMRAAPTPICERCRCAAGPNCPLRCTP